MLVMLFCIYKGYDPSFCGIGICGHGLFSVVAVNVLFTAGVGFNVHSKGVVVGLLYDCSSCAYRVDRQARIAQVIIEKILVVTT
jgi:hypothetical protein